MKGIAEYTTLPYAFPPVRFPALDELSGVRDRARGDGKVLSQVRRPGERPSECRPSGRLASRPSLGCGGGGGGGGRPRPPPAAPRARGGAGGGGRGGGGGGACPPPPRPA